MSDEMTVYEARQWVKANEAGGRCNPFWSAHMLSWLDAVEERDRLLLQVADLQRQLDHWKAAAEQLWAGEKAQDEEDRGQDYLERTGQISAEPEHGGF